MRGASPGAHSGVHGDAATLVQVGLFAIGAAVLVGLPKPRAAPVETEFRNLGTRAMWGDYLGRAQLDKAKLA